MSDIIEVEFDKIVCEGKTLGRKDGKVVFSYGVIPGEKARIKKVIERRNYIEGEVVEVLTTSPFRTEPQEDHFLSCSPWQIIKYEKQIEYKKKMILEGLYQSMKEAVDINLFYPAQKIYGYRTKIEYSFTDSCGMSVAFHKRGDYSVKIPLKKGCILINELANSVAYSVVEQMKKMNIDVSALKSLVVRYSFYENCAVTALFLKDERLNPEICLELPYHKGHVNVYSKPQSSVSSADRIVSVKGIDFITEKIGDMFFSYGFDCFFQNNIDLFSKAVDIIKERSRGFDKIVDLYCGVGVIGISVSENAKEVVIAESVKSSFDYSNKNIIRNSNGAKITALNLSSEEINSDIIKDCCLIVDPPRSGISKKLIKKIFSSLPPRIIYLSCNPVTQGRDLVYLAEKYRLSEFYGFDFYPNTPHAETLAVLDRK